MYLIGLTGGIAAGKSTVARQLAELGCVHIDADQLAREVVEPGTPALAAITDAFGDTILQPDGSLNRPALGSIVFTDPEALARLNAIVHPAVRELTRQRIAAAGERDPEAIVVYDVPLLAEAAPGHPFDLIVVVQADEDVRVERMISLRGMSREEALSRIRSQVSDADRARLADVIIDTGGTLDHTQAQVSHLLDRVRAGDDRKTFRRGL